MKQNLKIGDRNGSYIVGTDKNGKLKWLHNSNFIKVRKNEK